VPANEEVNFNLRNEELVGIKCLLDMKQVLSINKNLMATPTMWKQADSVIALGILQFLEIAVPFRQSCSR